VKRNSNKRKIKSGIMAGIFLLMLACLLLAATSATAGTYLHLSRGIVKCFDEGTNSWQVCSAGTWSPNQVTGVAVTYQSKAGESMTFTPAVGYAIKYTGINGWRTDTGYPPPESATSMDPVGNPDTVTLTQWILINSYGGTNYYENIVAYVEPKPYTITRTAGAHGAIAGDAIVRHGNSATYTFTPATGYKVADVLVDGVSVGAVSSYTLTNVTAPHTIAVTFGNAPPVITSVTCPASLGMGETGTCSTVASASSGTLAYRWTTGPASTLSTAQGPSTDVYFMTGGTKTVTLEAYIVENPAASATMTATVNVTPINMTLTGGCPETGNKNVPLQCAVTGTTDWGTPAYSWTANNADVSFNPVNASSTQAVISNAGNRTVTTRMYLVERPHVYIEKTSTVSVALAPPVITGVTCMESVVVGQPVTCTVTATVAEGAISYQWTVPAEEGTVTKGNTATATIGFKKAGQQTVNVKAFISSVPAVFATSSANVTVTENPITATVSCPAAGMSGQEITCSVNASVGWGTPKYKWSADQQTVARAVGNQGHIKFLKAGNATVKLDISLVEASFITQTFFSQPVEIEDGSQFKPVVTGPRQTYTRIPNEYTVSAPCLETNACTVAWSIDGEEKTGTSITLTFTEPKILRFAAQTKLLSGEQGKMEVFSVYVTELPKPMFTIVGPSVMFTGQESEYEARISQLHTKLPVKGKWLNEEPGAEPNPKITVVPTAAGTSEVAYTAWIDGQQEATSKTLSRKIKVVEYMFPQPKIEVKSTEGYAPCMISFKTVDTNKRIPGAVYTVTYNWDFGDGETLTTDKTPVSHTYLKEGSYTAKMTATDAYGNTTTDQVVMNIGVIPIQISLKASSSNTAMRAPLTVHARSAIAKKAALDRVASHEWLVNGVKVEGTSPEYMKTLLPDPGTYTVTFKATMKSGAIGEATKEVTVVPNQNPTCTVNHTDQPLIKTVVFTAECSDPDGRLAGFRWDLDDGRGYRPGFTRASVRVAATRTFTVKLEAKDDAGGITETVYPVTITR
jgi:hypothetical protein